MVASKWTASMSSWIIDLDCRTISTAHKIARTLPFFARIYEFAVDTRRRACGRSLVTLNHSDIAPKANIRGYLFDDMVLREAWLRVARLASPYPRIGGMPR